MKVISDEKRIYLSCKSLLTKQEIERLLLFYCFVFPTFDNILLAMCPTKNRFSTIRGISMFKKAIFFAQSRNDHLQNEEGCYVIVKRVYSPL